MKLQQTPIEKLRTTARVCGLEHMLRTDEELAELTAAADRARLQAKEADKRPFDVGDLVQLKSGGHGMVVTDLRCARIVALAWSECGEMRDCDFPEQCLRIFEPSDHDIPF